MSRDTAPTWRRIGDTVVLFILAGVLFLSWFSHGLVEQGIPRLLSWLGVSLVGIWGIIGWAAGEWDRRELLPAKILVGLLLLATGWGYLQTIPLPSAFVAGLSGPWRDHLNAMVASGLTPPESIPLATAPERALAASHQLLAATLCLIGVAMLATRRRSAACLIGLVAVYGILEGLTGLLHWVTVEGARAHGAIYNPNHWAAIVASCSIVALVGLYAWSASKGEDGLLSGRSPLILLLLPIGAAMVAWLAALSRGSAMSLVVVIIPWVALEWAGRRDRESGKSLLPTGLAFLALAFLVAIAGAVSLDRLLLRFLDVDLLTANSRILLWMATISGWSEAPLVGLGYGGAEFAINRHAGFPLVSLPGWTHNDPLQWICEWGILGTVLIGLLAVWFSVAAIRIRRERQRYLPFDSGLMNRACWAALAVLLVHSFFDFHLRIPVVGYVALILLALGLQSGSYFRRPW
ncbi:MAG: O-antigen ligase family protein [Candidatus Sumerlaeia bacterium]|nr:O-antigen ligase family protein [Candidatus Sumerlaeia bacterium]